MAITENVPYFRPGQEVTARATTAIPVNTLVKIVSGGTGTRPHVAAAAAGDVAFGIAGREAAEGDHIRVVREGIAPIIAGESITAASAVAVGADGKAVASVDGTNTVGIATADAEADGYVPVALNL